jgi:hypothetical protein
MVKQESKGGQIFNLEIFHNPYLLFKIKDLTPFYDNPYLLFKIKDLTPFYEVEW